MKLQLSVGAGANYAFSLVAIDTVNFLGISIVGQTNEDGSGGGIFVGSVMKG